MRFLNAVEREVPDSKTVHTILDNYTTHKHPKVIEWLGRHLRWTFHFTPTWLNAVEGFFASLTKGRLKRGVFKGVADHNQISKPFVWTADPDKIIAAAAREHQVLGSICRDPHAIGSPRPAAARASVVDRRSLSLCRPKLNLSENSSRELTIPDKLFNVRAAICFSSADAERTVLG